MNAPSASPSSELPPAHAGVPRPAATVVIARDGPRGLEVLMPRRSPELAFGAGAYVFPGGKVDRADGEPGYAARSPAMDDAQASARLKLPSGGLAYYVAAIRECFEEVGLLLASPRAGAPLDPATVARIVHDERRRMHAGECTFLDILERYDLVLATDQIEYIAHWNTMAGRPRRFTTRFFLTVAPADHDAVHDASETVDTVWIRPADALAASDAGDMELMHPTFKTLQGLAAYADARAALVHARELTPVTLGPPRPAQTREGMRTLYPGDFAYDEVARLDPHRTGSAWGEIVPGTLVTIAPDVRRLTAPNPGMMTGPGTNTYLIGDRTTGIAVIDPGPPLDEHLGRILEAGEGAIRWILYTHTHSDHSPGARLLRERTGARIYGIPAPEHGNQDRSSAPDHVVHDGERLSLAGVTLRVLHTPGHASNQCCYLLEAHKLLFTGDHLMQGSTVVINPPDGEMHTYFRQLERLYDEDLACLAPGHGFLLGQPYDAVLRVLRHRLQRENKVVKALTALGPATEATLLPAVYNDTPEKLHGMAARSLLAHLIKLERDGRARQQGGVWSMIS